MIKLINQVIFFANMEKVETKDGSVTFYNEKFDEHYHCLAGARLEAIKKFIEPTNIKEGDVILDVCFGLGYNSAAALDHAKKLTIIALENDELVLEKIQDIDADFENYGVIKEVARNKVYNKDGIKIKLLLGDARETIKQVKETVDVVFFDPFSPKKCPELWTKEFFTDVYEKMNSGGILATYSCATHVRQKMKDIGFKVIDGPIFGRKSPATIGIKT